MGSESIIFYLFVGLLVLLLILFAMSALPFAYVFSYLNGKISTVVRLLTYIPLGIGIVKNGN